MLVFEGVFAGYGGSDVLRGVDLVVEEGSLTCIVGPNGAGKSTLMKLVSGLLHPRVGRLEFRGKSIARATPRQIVRQGIVQVMQSRNLFPELTVHENVELGAFLVSDAGVVRRRYAEVCEMFPIVAERSKDRAGSLSGGQQRMVEFARALMTDPVLVTLDEPSMGLEPRAAKIIYDSIENMHRAGRSVLLVEQNVRAGLERATHGVVMEAGRVRLEGTGNEVLSNPQMRALYLGGTIEEGKVASSTGVGAPTPPGAP